uniref:Uncharacterized protein n=2 Tax=Lygus hesperus TaxID=30085 RepID=A0A146LTB1_LYGHE
MLLLLIGERGKGVATFAYKSVLTDRLRWCHGRRHREGKCRTHLLFAAVVIVVSELCQVHSWINVLLLFFYLLSGRCKLKRRKRIWFYGTSSRTCSSSSSSSINNVSSSRNSLKRRRRNSITNNQDKHNVDLRVHRSLVNIATFVVKQTTFPRSSGKGFVCVALNDVVDDVHEHAHMGHTSSLLRTPHTLVSIVLTYNRSC